MRILVDASLLVAAFVEAEIHHASAIVWLNGAVDNDGSLVMASHTIAEVYAGLTKANRVPPIQAGHIIEHLLSMVDQVIELSREDYGRAVARVAADDLKGGIIYDAVLAQAARKAGADSIVTLNQKHFALVWPAEKLVTI